MDESLFNDMTSDYVRFKNRKLNYSVLAAVVEKN